MRQKIINFFRDILVSALAFYVPAFFWAISCSFMRKDYIWTWVYYADGVVSTITSLGVFFWASSKWKEPPSAFPTLIGVWFGGPISFIAGVYMGYLPALFLLLLVYFFIMIVRVELIGFIFTILTIVILAGLLLFE